MRKATIILLLVFIFVPNEIASADEIYSINDFKRSYFKIISQNEGFYKIQSQLEAATNELPIAFGFIDRDFYTDIVTVSNDFKQISIYFYSEENGSFSKKMTTPKLPTDETVISAKITYLTNTSDYPNIMVVSESLTSKRMFMHAFQISVDQSFVYSITENSNLLVSVDNGPKSHSMEPIHFQISNDSQMTEYWLVSDAGVRTVITYDRTVANKAPLKTPFIEILDGMCAGCIDYIPAMANQLAFVGSHAFTDLNGDGRADLVLESLDESGNRLLEIYMFQNSGKFGLSKTIPISKDYSIGTWVDFQEKKILDVVFWNKKDNKLYIHQGSINTGAKIAQEDQFMDNGFIYSIPSLENPGADNSPIVLNILPGAKIQENPALRIYGLVRFVDLDLDGYLDLVINTIDTDGTNNVHFFQNVACTGTTTTPCRTFMNEFTHEKVGIVQKKNSIQTSLFDWGERGFT